MDLITKLEKDGKITLRKKHKMGILEGEEAADDSEPLHLEFGKSAAKKSDPAKAQEFFHQGAGFFEQANYAKAVRCFHDAINAQADHWQSYQYMGGAYAAQGMVNEAMGAYERMCELNTDPALKAWVDQWKVQAGVAA